MRRQILFAERQLGIICTIYANKAVFFIREPKVQPFFRQN